MPKRTNQMHGSNYGLAMQLLVLLTLFAFCAKARAQPTNMIAGMADSSGLRVSLDSAATVISATWHRQDPITDIYEYEVTLKEKDSINEIVYVKDRKKTFYDLDPCVNYTVKIQPFDRDGRNIGKPAFAEARTDEAAPPSVRLLSGTNSTAESLSLSWMRPDTACAVTDYTITYAGVAKWGQRETHTGSATIDQEDPNGSIMTTTIDGLLPYADYTVMVAASTEAGQGKTAVMTKTTEQDKPSQPTNLNALKTSSKSITMVWKEPKERKGIVDKYNVTWFILDQVPSWEIATHIVHIIAHLESCTTYTVRVAGITKGGEGDYIEKEVTTDPEAPHLRTPCHLHPDNSDTVVVTWAKPDSACTITGYKVFQPDDRNAMKDVATSELSADFKLKAGLTQRVCVAVKKSEAGIGAEACCDPTPIPKTAAPIIPSEQMMPHENGAASHVGNGVQQTSGGPILLWASVGAAAAILVTVWQ